MYEIDKKEQLFSSLIDSVHIPTYTTPYVAQLCTRKGGCMASRKAPVPWNEVDWIRYNGDAINLFPEKMSLSCALGHVREMRAMILTVRYKLCADMCMISGLPHEERLLITLAHIVMEEKKKKLVLANAYRWVIVEINKIPTEHCASEGLPMFDPVHDQDVWNKLAALLISEDGSLRPHTQLILSSP